ncbi:primary-amine oxidase [Dactylosporangium sp. NPDC051484]|uniref:primary-amine oxidase n=1 Tax=Dactylosporangium sp. NPDC051484 TaxID=3154942 RepID=UPI00344F19A0
MTVTEQPGQQAGKTVTHPLQRLSAAEITAARALVEQAGLLTPTTRFADLGLDEPHLDDPQQVDRRVRILLLDVATGRARTVVVSLVRGAVDEVVEHDPAVDGQPPILLEEFMRVEEIVKADPGWVEAMTRRGISDLELVRACPLSAGWYDRPGEAGLRMLRVLSFLQHRPEDHCWSHPIDGVVAYVDLTAGRVIELVDGPLLPIPAEEANHDDPRYVGTLRDLKPIEITQPHGPSFTVDGDVVTWGGSDAEGWRFRVGFNAREGLTLHELTLGGRPVLDRASIAEMVVPYGDPANWRAWQNYFDVGEYQLGAQVAQLQLGCDCLGEIYYFDAVLADADGNPETKTNAICLHEEDAGVGWRHFDLFTESNEVRRQRRLVISFWATVGNYDYGFFWYLYLDGRIEFEAKATGAPFTSSYVEGSPWATKVAPQLGTPGHQHFFCARMVLAVDGRRNAVDEVDLVRVPAGPENPLGNAFTRRFTRLRSEAEATRIADPAVGREWHVTSTEHRNTLGQPTGFVLQHPGGPLLLADDRSSIAARAAFAKTHVQFTRYAPGERYPAGDLPNQHPGGAGLPAYSAADRALDGEHLVAWVTVGMTHFPRPEDWPIMPVAKTSFALQPYGFFTRNPALNVPPSTASHCATTPGTGHEGHH